MKLWLGIRMVRAATVLGVAALLVGCETSSPSTDGVDDFFTENPVAVNSALVDPNAPIREPQIIFPTPEGDPDTDALAMGLSPESISLETDGDSVIIIVDGGVGPYTWAVTDISKGSIIETGSASAAYQRSSAGDNVVTCSDSQGRTVMVVIAQP